MKKYEYLRVIKGNTSDFSVDEYLRAMGGIGWLLVYLSYDKVGVWITMIFTREV
jgi:hypothetical protein